MATTTKASATPRLRFPEFRDAPAWERRKLRDLLAERKQRNRELQYGRADVLSVSGEFGCVNQIELLGRSYAGVSVKDYHVVETGDLVYTKSPLKNNPFGIIKENKRNTGIVSTLYAVYRATNMSHASFLDHYFSRDYHLNSYLQPIVRKGPKNDMKVNNSAVLSGDIFAPEVREQARIAEFLTSLDDVIAAQARKVAALKAHKRGLMQQLFPREGETVPRLRFPEFRDGPAWRELTIGTWGRTIAGLSGKAGSDFGGGAPYVTYKQVFDRSRVDFSQCGRVRIADDEKQNDLRYGDILFTGSSETAEEVAFASVVLDDPPEPTFLNSFCFCVRPNQDADLSPHFLQYLFHSPIYRQRVQLLAQGSTRFNISKAAFLRLKVPLPSDDAEQRAIGECFASCEAQIDAEAEMLDAMKRHKAGLMQRLFPSPDAD